MSDPRDTKLGCHLAPQWISVFRQHLSCLGWWPHLADVASGPDSDLVVSARGELVANHSQNC